MKPLPVPDEAAETKSHGALLTAVHLQVVVVNTLTPPAPSAAPTKSEYRARV